MDPFGLSPEEANGKSIWSMLIHGGLGVVGCIPGVFGVVANLLDAALYFYEKDYFMATISLLSAASLGTATIAMKAFGATCTGIKVAKGAMLAYRAIDLVGNGVNFVRNAYALGGQANNIATKAYKGEKITGKDVGGLFLTGLGTFLSGVGTFASVKGLGKAADEFADAINYACFVAGTKINTIDGEKNIEDIEEGDYVLSEDPETGEQEYKPVVRTFINEKDVLMHIFIEDEEIVCTPEHPFYVEGIGFVLAKDLQEGNILRTSDKQNPQVTKVEKEYLDEPIKVYNFEVEDFHTYYVSEKSVLVHNDCKTISYTEYDEIYQSSIYNSEKDKVMLGKYDNGGPTGYIAKAGKEYTYFNLGKRWDSIKSKYNFTDEDMFKLFNESFLDDGINNGKTFYFSHNPVYDKGALGLEFNYLKKNSYIWDDMTMTMNPMKGK